MEPLKILFVEDLPTDYELAQWHLRKNELEFHSICVDTQPEFLEALNTFLPDLIISDYSMPEFNGLQALQLTLDHKPEIPFIILTGSINEETAVLCMKAGATDYVLKEKMHRLPFSVRETMKLANYRKDKILAERQLRVSEEKFRDIFESANVGKAIITDTETISVNKAFADMLGYKREDLEKLPWQKVTPLEDIKKTEEMVNTLHNGEADAVRYEKRYIHKNGSYLWVDVSVNAHRDADGKVEYLFSTIIDISERKEAELALQESEKKFRSLFRDNRSMMLLIDPITGKIIDANPTACEYYGYEHNSIININISQINPLPQKKLFEALSKAVNAEKNAFQFQHRLANGDIREVEVNSSPIEHQGTTILLSIVNDITARVRAETAFKELNEVINLFIQNSPIYAFIKEVTESTNTVIIASENYSDMIGIPGSEMTGKTMLDLFPAEYAEKFMADDWGVVKNGQVLKLDEEMNGKFYTSIKFPIQQGEKTLLAGYTIDLTERKKAENALEQKVNELMRFHNLTVDRELKMVELKKEINQLLQDAGKPHRYNINE